MTAFVTFSEPVTVSGSPRLALAIGTQTRQATYWTTILGNQVLFQYQVQASDVDQNGLSIGANALTLNGGSIRNASGNDAALGLGSHAIANAQNLLVNSDQSAPSFAQTVPAQTYHTGTAVNVSLPAATGGMGELAYDLAPSLPDGLRYTAPADATTGGVISGTPRARFARTEYTLTVRDSDADRTAEDATLAFTIAVAGAASPAFAETGAVQRHTFPADTPVAIALPAATGGDGVLRYGFDPDPPAGLTFDETALAISETPTTPQVVAPYTLTATDADGDRDTLVIRLAVLAANAPTVTAVTVDPYPHGGDTFPVDFAIVPLVTFSSPVVVSGSPRLALTIGTQTRQAEYLMAYNNGVLFRYRVQAADGDADGLSIAANALTLNGGSIRAGGVDASLDLGTHAFANAANLKVNVQPAPAFTQTVAPQRYRKGTAVAVTLPAATGGNGALEYALSPVLPFRLTFDRATRTISGTPTVRFDQTEYALTAHDADADRSPGDAATLTFSLAVAGGIKPAFGAPFSVPSAVVGHVVAMSLPAGG